MEIQMDYNVILNFLVGVKLFRNFSFSEFFLLEKLYLPYFTRDNNRLLTTNICKIDFNLAADLYGDVGVPDGNIIKYKISNHKQR